MSESVSSTQANRSPLQLVRLPVDKPQAAVEFLQAQARGVMDLIAHFWERLAQTPPLQRPDLHLVVAAAIKTTIENITISQLDVATFVGAMLYVPKAHRADVLALDASTAAAFAGYISQQGPKTLKAEELRGGVELGSATVSPVATNSSVNDTSGSAPKQEASPSVSLTDLSCLSRGTGTNPDPTEVPAEPPSLKDAAGNGRVPIDFLTGEAKGIGWMTPLLLPLVHKRVPARQLVNVVMQLPAEVACASDEKVRLARDNDIPTLNRWRRQYREERGILFDADMDAWVQNQRVFVYEVDGQVVSLAKIDLELQSLTEIGGVYTFPEFRHQGYGARIVSDLAWRIRQSNKMPTIQVDEQNPALGMYETAGWRTLGKLARVWLTG